MDAISEIERFKVREGTFSGVMRTDMVFNRTDLSRRSGWVFGSPPWIPEDSILAGDPVVLCRSNPFIVRRDGFRHGRFPRGWWGAPDCRDREPSLTHPLRNGSPVGRRKPTDGLQAVYPAN